MTNEEFLRGKTKYNELSQELQRIEEERESKLLEIETRMKSLEEDEKVKEYIALMSEKEKLYIDRLSKHSINERKSKIIYEVFDDICKNTHDSNNIYVYMGLIGKFYRYKNIETTKEKFIGLDKVLNFLENNQIIYSPYPCSEFFFESVRQKYLMYLSQFSQKTAESKVLKLGKKPKSGR